jgi:ribosomal protein S18 acetylase RimI-like enzyme
MAINPLPSIALAIPASEYNFEQLAAIYNEARTDYIVPMPMNAPRMEAYVYEHDIDLDASVVLLNESQEPIGVGMLGVRDRRGWISRLGVLPACRGYKGGEFIMRRLIEHAQMHGIRWIQLEVIQGNEPACRLFLKLGFQPTRELLIVRRPPGLPHADLPQPDAHITALTPDQVMDCLAHRPPGASWIEETPSLLKAGKLKGLYAELPTGQGGWLVYQASLFQLAHFVLNLPDDGAEEALYALLYTLHQQNPKQDTKVENIPAHDIPWRIFQALGYVEAFRRIEMVLQLT